MDPVLKPYDEITDTNFPGKTTIILSREMFADVPFKDGKSTFSFQKCTFDELTIVNDDEIPFEDISLSFWKCTIKHIDGISVVTRNISLYFGNSEINGVIRNENILHVELNNCATVGGGLFIDKVQRAVLSYSKENINIAAERLKEKQAYYFDDCESLRVRSNFTGKENELIPNIHLACRYGEKVVDGRVNVSGLLLQSLSLSGTPKGFIEIENTQINEWYIYNFTPKENVNLYNISPAPGVKESKVAFHKCNLDKVWFDNVNFDSYSIISFYRTQFAQSKFTACEFPATYQRFDKITTLENIHYPENYSANRDKDLFESILQLKRSLESTGNYQEALKLQAVAHHALRSVSGLSCADHFILWLSGWSNRHGLSISAALGWFIAITIPVYLIYLLALGKLLKWDQEFDPTLIGYYFSFIDITHKTDFIGVKPNGGSLAIDYFGKVLTGFFIYQFIAAFRKYGKR